MRLNSISSNFIFQFPTDFLPEKIINSFQKLLEKNWVQYDNVLDYINSTILSVDFPGLSLDLPEQIMYQSKKRSYMPSTNPYDIVSSTELNLELRSVDSDLNYWILHSVFMYYYKKKDAQYTAPFILSVLDINRDEIYQIKFREIIMKNISERTFNHSQQAVDAKNFTVTLNFNYWDIEFMLDKNKILVMGDDGEPVIKDNTII